MQADRRRRRESRGLRVLRGGAQETKEHQPAQNQRAREEAGENTQKGTGAVGPAAPSAELLGAGSDLAERTLSSHYRLSGWRQELQRRREPWPTGLSHLSRTPAVGAAPTSLLQACPFPVWTQPCPWPCHGMKPSGVSH